MAPKSNAAPKSKGTPPTMEKSSLYNAKGLVREPAKLIIDNQEFDNKRIGRICSPKSSTNIGLLFDVT